MTVALHLHAPFLQGACMGGLRGERSGGQPAQAASTGAVRCHLTHAGGATVLDTWQVPSAHSPAGDAEALQEHAVKYVGEGAVAQVVAQPRQLNLRAFCVPPGEAHSQSVCRGGW